jgi:hypothetical protein
MPWENRISVGMPSTPYLTESSGFSSTFSLAKRIVPQLTGELVEHSAIVARAAPPPRSPDNRLHGSENSVKVSS